MRAAERQLPPDLESEIAKIVRTYLDAARGDDLSQEQEALRWLCSGLEPLLQRRLEDREGIDSFFGIVRISEAGDSIVGL